MAASATVIDCLALAGYGNDYFNGKFWMQVVKNANSVGAAPEREYRQITDYSSADGVFTCTAFSANVEANDSIVVLHESLPFLKYVEYLTGSGNWTVPTGVTVIDWVLVAAGGSGGGCASTSASAGGGGGAETVIGNGTPVSPGTLIPYVIPASSAGGAAGDNNGTGGATASFMLITAYGGLAGQKGTLQTGGTGGQTAVNGGAQNIKGTVTSVGTITRYGGGGGGQGATAVGGVSIAPSGANFGSGGGSYRAGADGVSGASGNGTDATANTGGGGSGAKSNGTGATAGGASGSGYLKIMWR
jgi:hypothetical protein